MAISIKNPETDRLARELAKLTGDSITQAVAVAIRKRFVRETGQNPDAVRAAIKEIQARLAEAPVLDDRTDDEIIGYDEFGLPS